MRDFLSKYNGNVAVNGEVYTTGAAALTALDLLSKNGETGVKVLILSKEINKVRKREETNTNVKKSQLLEIKVRQYMTKPSTPDFDFHKKYNNDTPMPLRVMTGYIIGETPRMYKMKLHGQINGQIVTNCLKCGRAITNPVSQYFGLGVECGGHSYQHPFSTDVEFEDALAEMKARLKAITWEGWIPKSAIEKQTILD